MNDNSHTLPRSEREWLQRHQDLLSAATKLFIEHGVSGTTMQMIADQAGFSVGYLYKHFGGKQQLLDEIVARHLMRYDEARKSARAAQHLSPLNQFREGIKAITYLMGEQPGLMPFLGQIKNSQPQRFREFIRRFDHEDTELMHRAQEAGELPAGDARLIAMAVNGALWGMVETLIAIDPDADIHRLPEFVEQFVLLPISTATLPKIEKDTLSS
jgi:AcrR family transcriptional regulator